MRRKERTKRSFIVLSIAAILVVSLIAGCGTQQSNGSASSGNLQQSVALLSKISALKASDGHALILPAVAMPAPPLRPSNPNALPETNILHWWDMEYSYLGDKVNIPKSPDNGSIGKTIYLLEPGPHPYFTAYTKGAQMVADTLGMNLHVVVGNWTAEMQMQQVNEAIAQHPDMIVIAPVSPDVTVRELRDINQAGIPVIVSNMQPSSDAMKYAITYTGPNIWNQSKVAADAFAKAMNYQGDYVNIRHMPGAPPYWGRTWGYIDELATVAPNMHCLAYQTADLDAVKTQALVSQWLSKYGSKLKGITTADDSFTIVGAEQALKSAGRTNVIISSVGNSKVGMDFIKSGVLYNDTYQSAGGDGALGIYEGAKWFDGQQIPPARFLPDILITKANVDQFLPAQW